ncbi:MAG: CCA tRNA nucleotidyltransferase [Candidatus Stahlbacteria bacterium]|nr:CCA tRNA nucleotidyltransferase [Candidatus Stahlbacteria bacterium]
MEKGLAKIGAIGKEQGIKVYAVGGPVRDILLGKKEFGIDIAVEGNGIEFAKLLQKMFGGKLRIHRQFGTASLIYQRTEDRRQKTEERVQIDIASCREEEYTESAKLPKVGTRHGVSLHEDLKRRDFTINAIALDLQTNEIIDPFNGRKDLELGLIRILHPKSFIDDPTRIFRALRFSGRLGFRLTQDTEMKARKTIQSGLIKKLTPKRIRNEMVLILKENSRAEIIDIMNDFGVLEQIGLRIPQVVAPGSTGSLDPANEVSYCSKSQPSVEDLFKNIDKNIVQYPEFSIQDSELWFVYLLGLLPETRNPITDNRIPIELTKKELQKVINTNIIISKINILENTDKPSEIYNLLKNVVAKRKSRHGGTGNDELLFIASAYPKVKDKILSFVNTYRKIKLHITGKDLMLLGIEKGPKYNELLTAILTAKLDGKIRNKKDELEFVNKYRRE